MSVRCNHAYRQTPRKGANFPDLPVVQHDLIISENKLYQSEFLGSAARSIPHVQGDVINRKSIRRFSGLVWLWTGSASLRFSDWCRSLRESFPSSDYRKEAWKEVTAGYMWHASVCIFTLPSIWVYNIYDKLVMCLISCRELPKSFCLWNQHRSV